MLDPHSPTWGRVREFAQARITSGLKQLETDIDEIKTAKLRGEIRSMRDLLALGSPDRMSAAQAEEDQKPERPRHQGEKVPY